MAPRLPRRIDVMLRGESLINDAGALALYAVAVSASSLGGTRTSARSRCGFCGPSWSRAAVGVAAGYVIYLLRRIATQPSLEATISVLTPFALYLPAEVVGGSGVVAVVAGGLLLSRLMPRVVSSRSRVLGFDFWRVSSFVINGALFVLIGLQARTVLDYLLDDGVHALWLTLVITATVFAVRLGWVALMAPAIRLLDRRPAQRARRVPFRVRALLVWGGFRGAVSLAAALAVPALIADGGVFPDRELVVFVTFGTILVLLVGQGATMPLVLRRASIPHTDDEAEAEHQLATQRMADHALRHLESDAAAEGAAAAATERVRDHHHLRALQRVEDHELRETDEDVRRLTLRGVARKREALDGLRRANRIDDEVYLRIQGMLDHEELRWEHPDESVGVVSLRARARARGQPPGAAGRPAPRARGITAPKSASPTMTISRPTHGALRTPRPAPRANRSADGAEGVGEVQRGEVQGSDQRRRIRREARQQDLDARDRHHGARPDPEEPDEEDRELRPTERHDDEEHAHQRQSRGRDRATGTGPPAVLRWRSRRPCRCRTPRVRPARRCGGTRSVPSRSVR